MITASIVVYHTAAHELLRVINCAVRSAIEILYIIDNSSNDSLRELKDVSEKIVYIHSENLVYGSGHNIGIRKAVEKGATYHAVLNPDIYWNDSVIEALSHFMDLNYDCGLDAYVTRQSVQSVPAIRKAKKAIRKAFENSMAGKGSNLVEIVSTCNSGWKMSPAKSNEWMVENMFPFYPLGDLKDK